MAGNSHSHVVLVVDDDTAVRGALRFALEVEGFKVRDYGGAVALLADQNLPAVGCLVVDYRMPIMDGLELVGVLRERGIKAPVVMITGRASKGLAAQAARLGVQQVLEKPLSDGQLLTAIRAAIAAPKAS